MKIDKIEIQDVCHFAGGSQPPKEVFSSFPKDGYVRLIQIRDYKTDSFLTYIPQNLAKRFCNRTDIMIGRYGPPIFQICRGLKGAYNVALMKAIPKENILNEYLYYFLKQDAVFKYIDALSPRTGGQTGVDVECLKKYPICLPSLEYQEKVVKVLSTLDAKIELNNRINAELESLAKTIYDYWFVQFDFPYDFDRSQPDEHGKPYKSSGGEMVWSDVLDREIPAGWKVDSLWNIADYFNGLAMQKYRPVDENYLKVIKIREMNEGFSENTEFVRTTIPKQAIVEDGDVLL
jgi:type I restriction enzyme, S subunit